MLIKYKAGDLAKDLNLQNKQVLQLLGEKYGEGKKYTTVLTENEIDYVLEKLSQEHAVDNFEAYLTPKAPKAAPVKEAAKPAAPAKEAPKAPAVKPAPAAGDAKPAAPAPTKPAAPAPAKPAQPAQQPAPKAQPAAPAAKPAQPAPKPAQPSAPRPARPMQNAAPARQAAPIQARPQKEKGPAQQRGETVTVTIDTRTTDVNLDKFNTRYEDMAGSNNNNNQRKSAQNTNTKKQKFTNRNNRYQPRGQQPTRKRETEAEKLQRLQLEKARRAQLKVLIPEEITVGELASRLKQTAAAVIKKLMPLGIMAAMNDVIDFDTASLIAEEFGAKVEREVHVTIEERLFEAEVESDDGVQERPPVVVVMGHVDHGKTSILDAIRKTAVTEGEAGGITQHIGAYQVERGGKLVTFLDTPGHEAFTSMRARGADLTDIAVLVVAADDGIMPQTIESINHAKAAGVSIIVAINKMDKPEANPDKVKEQLTQYGLVVEEWGGDVIAVPVSALTGQGIDTLLEMILLTAEVQELTANPDRRAKGAVIEARLDKGLGPVASILVQKGTLHKGDIVIAGTAVGRVRTMRDANGRELEEAGPSTPVEITGLTDVPAAGDLFDAVEDERLARELAEQRTTQAKEKEFSSFQKVTLDNLFSQIEEGERKELALIVKADVRGSVEAVRQSLEKLATDEVRVNVVHGGVGAISKSDVMLADASNAIIIGFNVRPDAVAKEEAARASVEIKTYRVIYDAINDITDALKGMHAPKFREVELGTAEVREVYKISSSGTIAGCYVTNGKVTRNAKIRIVRDGIVITENEIDSLRRFKDDVREVAQGYECGIGLEKFDDIKEGDVYEAFIMEEYRD